MGARFKAHRTRNDIAEGRLAGQPVTLARPHSYMNLSGGPVAALAAFYKLSPNGPWLSMTSSTSPSAWCASSWAAATTATTACGSITASLGTRDYYRVRFGIGRPPGRMDAAAFVLRGLLGSRAQGTPFRPRPLRRRGGGPDHQGPGEAQNEYHTDPAPG